jgi:hypothetical protein
MADPELTDIDRRVLAAAAVVERDDVAASQQAIALRAGMLMEPVVGALNRLWAGGYITASLTLTDAGRAVLDKQAA